jgi:hypothetical protein
VRIRFLPAAKLPAQRRPKVLCGAISVVLPFQKFRAAVTVLVVREVRERVVEESSVVAKDSRSKSPAHCLPARYPRS